jgi:hypothetical protein
LRIAEVNSSRKVPAMLPVAAKAANTSASRDGFQESVAAVGLRKVGIVLGLEVSRLPRNSVDWQQLLLCATDTLILDEESIYDPSAFNDRLLLGLKGTMSEAELHLLRSRMRGGILNKARRGELAVVCRSVWLRLADGRCARDPDTGIQASIAADFAGYVSWADFQTIQAQLRNNARPFGRPNPFGALREGPALLQGRVMCRKCGSPCATTATASISIVSVRATSVSTRPTPAAPPAKASPPSTSMPRPRA